MKLFPLFTLIALRMSIVLALAAITASAATPVIFHSSETAAPGDIITLQGDSFGTAPTVWMQRVTGSEGSLSPQLQLTVVNYTNTFVSAQFPFAETNGLFAIWVKDGTNQSANVFVNRARAWGAWGGLAGTVIDPSRSFRIWGRNLFIGGATPTVSFVNGGTVLSATVTTNGSDPYTLIATAPSTIVAGTSYTIRVNNGFGGTYGNDNAGPALMARAGGTDTYGLGVPWGADFTFSTNIYNVKNDPRLSSWAVGNGVTDDTAAIQGAINAANAAGGGVVYFPAGTYRTTINNVTANVALVLKSKVVLAGAGMNLSQIFVSGWDPDAYGFNITGSGLSLVGFKDIDFYNKSDGAKQSIYITTSSKVFALRSRFQADVGHKLYWINSTNLLVKDCEIIHRQTNSTPGGLLGRALFFYGNNRDIQFTNNTVTHHVGYNIFIQSVRTLIENSHFTRDTLYATGLHGGGIYPSGSSDVAIIGNTIGKSGSGPYQVNSDGESIMDENVVSSLERDYGYISGATSNALADYGKNWTYDYGQPAANMAGQGYWVAIVNGPGAGQLRKIISNTSNTLTVDTAWNVIPTSSSRYTIMIFGQRLLIKANAISERAAGIMFYNSSIKDVAIVKNTLNETGGSIWLRTSYQPFTIPKIFGVQMDCYIANNCVTNTLNWYRFNWIGSELVGVSTNQGFGTGHYGIEYRLNSFQTAITNYATGLDGDGYRAVAKYNAGASQDDTTVALRGVLFQNNTAVNTRDAFHFSTGDYNSLLVGNVLQGVSNVLLDVQGNGATHASIGTTFAHLTGLWTFDNADAADSSGNENTGALVNSPQFSTDIPFAAQGNAYSVSFGGTNRMEITNAPALNPNNEMTVAFWVKCGTNGQLSYARLVSKNNSNAPLGWEVVRNGTTDGAVVRIDTTAGTNQLKGTISGVMDNAWHHVAYVLNRGTVKAYKDGGLVSTSTYAHGGGFANSALPLCLGSRADGSGDSSLLGLEDDVRIYLRELTATEISALANP